MKQYDKIFPINEQHSIRKKPVPLKNIVERFWFGEYFRTFIHFLERDKEGLKHVYVVNYAPANNISTEIITEDDFKMARVQMVVKSVETDKEKDLLSVLMRLKETHPHFFNDEY